VWHCKTFALRQLPDALYTRVCRRFGRKFLLIQGGIQLTICEIVVGILIAVGIGSSGGQT
jgi:hypothetical protein